MNETAVQAAIQTTLKAMTEFADADVVINDWSLLDQSSLAAPYVIITNAVNINSGQDTADEQATYTIPVTLIERFTHWKASLDNMRTRREAVFNAFIGNTNVRSANGLAGTNIKAVRTEGPITEYYDRGLAAEQMAVAMPAFLQQTLALDVEEF
jgi:hypothetical protein